MRKTLFPLFKQSTKRRTDIFLDCFALQGRFHCCQTEIPLNRSADKETFAIWQLKSKHELVLKHDSISRRMRKHVVAERSKEMLKSNKNANFTRRSFHRKCEWVFICGAGDRFTFLKRVNKTHNYVINGKEKFSWLSLLGKRILIFMRD